MKNISDLVEAGMLAMQSFFCVLAAVTEDLLAAVYCYYKQRHLTLQTRSLLLSFYSRLYLQEQGHTHIAR